jgi:mRNA interferase RelE/StbE
MPRGEGAGSSPIYRIFETQQFLRDMSQLGPARQAQLGSKLRAFVYPLLETEPRFGPNIKRLKNWDPPTWRYRIGDWRFFYEIDERKRIVLMIASQHRKNAYR